MRSRLRHGRDSHPGHSSTQRRNASVYRDQVVLPAGCEESVGNDLWSLSVKCIQVRARNLVRFYTGRIGYHLEEVAFAKRPYGVEMPLRIKSKALVRSAVKVNCQLRDHHQRIGAQKVDFAVQRRDSPGHSQVTIQPGVAQQPAIGLNINLCETVCGRVGVRFELETG